MRTVSTSAVLLLVLVAGCGHEIGDSCSLSSECSPDGDRICDQSSPGGYCTIMGCDENTCPDGSVCIRFFSVGSTNLSCTDDRDCSVDELCTLNDWCVPRLAEIRYCMKTCGNDGDCRDNYECRDEDLMLEHGGEPLPEQPMTKFCAPAPLAE